MIHLLAEGGYQGFFLGSTEKVILLAALVASVASVVTAIRAPRR